MIWWLFQLNFIWFFAKNIALFVNDTIYNDEQFVNSSQQLLESSFPRTKRFVCKKPSEGFQFCYYSIRVMEDYWKLNRKVDITNKAVIENCMKTTNYTFGFSHEVDFSQRTYIDDQKMKVKHLVDIFYYCCKECSMINKMNDMEIINFIGNLLLENLPKSINNKIYNYILDGSLPYCLSENGALAPKVIGIKQCVLLLDSCSINKIYIGPLLASKFDHLSQSTQRINKSLADIVSINFTKICPESECVYYLSPLEFFFYCCCERNFDLCAYTNSNEKLLSYVSKNAEAWLNDPEIRSFREVQLHDIKNDQIMEIVGRQWSYRKYIYSKPIVDERTGEVISTKNNIPLHLCAIGTFNLTIGNWKNEDFTVNVGERRMLPEPQQFCYYIASLQFNQTDRMPPTSIEMKYGSDMDEICKNEGCNIEAPNCLQDLISVNYVIARFRCCCSTNDLCNHLGHKNFEVTKQLINVAHIFPCISQSHSYLMIYFNRRFDDTYIKCSRFFKFNSFHEVMLIEDYSFFAPQNTNEKNLYNHARKLHLTGQNYNKTVENDCIRKIFLPLHDPFCTLYIPVLTNLIQCSCFQSPLLKQPCDMNFGEKVREEGPKIAVPICLKTSGNLNKLLSNDNFGILGPTKFKEVEIKNYPLCYDMVEINQYKHGIEHRSGPFDELINYLYDVSVKFKTIRRIMTFTISDAKRNVTRYLFTCYQRENYYPCNGPMAIRKQLLPEIIRKESEKFTSKDKSLCHVDGYNNRIKCKSGKGCFNFHTVHGIRRKGCIDKIPHIVSIMPKFRLLYTCYNHIWIAGNQNVHCIAIRENVSNSSIPLTDGIICCCRSTCTVSDSNSYMEMHYGYHPFQI